MSRIRWHFDTDELRDLEMDLSRAPQRAQRNVTKAISSSADLVQRRMKKQARGHRQLPKLPRSVTWELRGPLDAEIGYETTSGTQGRLAHILLYGSVNNAPIYDFRLPLWRSIPEIQDKVADAGESAVLGGAE